MNRADRKKQLIVQGALHRAEVLAAREAVEEALRPEAIARSVVEQVARTAVSAVRGVPAGAARLDAATVVPLAIDTLSWLSGGGRWRRTLRIALGAAAASAGASAWLRRRRAPGAREDDQTAGL